MTSLIFYVYLLIAFFAGSIVLAPDSCNRGVSVQATSLNQHRKNIQTGASRSCSTTFMSLSCELKFALHGRQYMVFVKVFQQATLLHFALLLLVQSGTIEPA